MKNMLKDALILFAITLVAGLLLGFVNDITTEPIAKAKEEAKQASYRAVFSDADRFENHGVDENVANAFVTETGYMPVNIDEVMGAYQGEKLLGYVITLTEHEGYGGDIQFAMGITVDGMLNGISLLSISETPGLGMEAGKVLVPQFANKEATLFSYTKTGATNETEIDAISGATITTSAIVTGVNAGIDYFEEALKGGEADE